MPGRRVSRSHLPLIVMPQTCSVLLGIGIGDQGGCEWKSRLSSIRAHSKSNVFTVPWTPSKSLDPFTHICPPFLYPYAVEKRHEHKQPPHLPSQHPIVKLKSEAIQQSGSLLINRVYLAMDPFQFSSPVHSHVCLLFLMTISFVTCTCRPSLGVSMPSYIHFPAYPYGFHGAHTAC